MTKSISVVIAFRGEPEGAQLGKTRWLDIVVDRASAPNIAEYRSKPLSRIRGEYN